jgi:hypothetical protein
VAGRHTSEDARLREEMRAQQAAEDAAAVPDEAGRLPGDTGEYGDPTITRGGRTLEYDESIGAYREPGAEATWSRIEEEAAAQRGPEVPLEGRPRPEAGAYAEPRMAPPEGYEVQPGDYNTGATGVRFQTAEGWERMRRFREEGGAPEPPPAAAAPEPAFLPAGERLGPDRFWQRAQAKRAELERQRIPRHEDGSPLTQAELDTNSDVAMRQAVIDGMGFADSRLDGEMLEAWFRLTDEQFDALVERIVADAPDTGITSSSVLDWFNANRGEFLPGQGPDVAPPPAAAAIPEPPLRAQLDAYLKSKPGLRTSEPGLRAAYRTVKARRAKTYVPFVRDAGDAGRFDEGRAMLAELLNEGKIDAADHDALVKILTETEVLPQGPDAVGTGPMFAEVPEAKSMSESVSDAAVELIIRTAREEPEPRVYGRPDEVMRDPTTEATRPVEGARFRLMESDDIIDSWDDAYDQTLQPRNTRTAMRQETVNRIAEKPDPVRLVEAGPNASEGPPVVTPEGMVIAGNHRSRGIRIADDAALESYRQYLIDNAERFGLDPEQIRAMRRPVLVREVPEQYATRAYAEAWNVATSGQGQTDVAIAMSQRISPALLRKIGVQKGESVGEAVMRPANTEARREIIAMLPERTRGNYLDDAGQGLSADGQQLLEVAVLARLLGGDKELVLRTIAARGREQKPSGRLAAAIRDAIGDLVEAEALVSGGERQAESLGPTLARTFDVLSAIEDYKPGAVGKVSPAAMRRQGATEDAIRAAQELAEGATGADIERQLDVLADDPVVAGLARTFRDMDRREMGTFFEQYVESVRRAPNPNEMTMFSTLTPEPESVRTILNRAITMTNEKRATEAAGSMFGTQELALIPDADGMARATFESAEGTTAVAAEVPVIESPDVARRPAWLAPSAWRSLARGHRQRQPPGTPVVCSCPTTPAWATPCATPSPCSSSRAATPG